MLRYCALRATCSARHVQFVIELVEPPQASSATAGRERWPIGRSIAMTRTVLAAGFVLGGVLAAHADNTVYLNALKRPRGDAELAADGRYCDQRVGPDRNG